MPVGRLVNVLRLFWVVIIVWYEILAFPYQVSQCQWPALSNEQLTDLPETTGNAATHVLLIADPQVLDHRSYPDRPAWLMWLSQRIVDFNMRKSWWATKRLNPDVVIFLGDMMDNGRYEMSDVEYETYYNRFKSIFALDETIPVYYIPGNHDVGIGISDEWSSHARERYISHFGPTNQRLEIANHTIVLLDAPAFVEEDRQRYVSGLSYERWAASKPEGAIAFAQQSAEVARASKLPTVLLTHIPLYRRRTANCGPFREHGTIREGAGYGYENTLSIPGSDMLLEGIRPSIIFSGDDHDYCEYRHSLSPSDDIPLSAHRYVKEVTVKSFSIAMGVKRPGFQLLSLIPPSASASASPQQTLNDSLCLLPFQLGTYVLVYVPLIGISVLVLFLYNLYRVYLSSSQSARASTPSRSPSRPIPPPLDVHSSGWGINLSAANHTLRKHDEPDETNEAAFMLPPPTPSVAITSKESRPRTYTFTISGRKWIADPSALRRLLSVVFGCCLRLRSDSLRGRRRTRLLRAFFADVAAVAWLPVMLFVAIMWWFL